MRSAHRHCQKIPERTLGLRLEANAKNRRHTIGSILKSNLRRAPALQGCLPGRRAVFRGSHVALARPAGQPYLASLAGPCQHGRPWSGHHDAFFEWRRLRVRRPGSRFILRIGSGIVLAISIIPRVTSIHAGVQRIARWGGHPTRSCRTGCFGRAGGRTTVACYRRIRAFFIRCGRALPICRADRL